MGLQDFIKHHIDKLVLLNDDEIEKGKMFLFSKNFEFVGGMNIK